MYASFAMTEFNRALMQVQAVRVSPARPSLLTFKKQRLQGTLTRRRLRLRILMITKKFSQCSPLPLQEGYLYRAQKLRFWEFRADLTPPLPCSFWCEPVSISVGTKKRYTVSQCPALALQKGQSQTPFSFARALA